MCELSTEHVEHRGEKVLHSSRGDSPFVPEELPEHSQQVGYFISKNHLGLQTFQSTREFSWSGRHSQSVSGSVGIMSSCLLLPFWFLVSLVLSCLHCLCFSQWLRRASHGCVLAQTQTCYL